MFTLELPPLQHQLVIRSLSNEYKRVSAVLANMPETHAEYEEYELEQRTLFMLLDELGVSF